MSSSLRASSRKLERSTSKPKITRRTPVNKTWQFYSWPFTPHIQISLANLCSTTNPVPLFRCWCKKESAGRDISGAHRPLSFPVFAQTGVTVRNVNKNLSPAKGGRWTMTSRTQGFFGSKVRRQCFLKGWWCRVGGTSFECSPDKEELNKYRFLAFCNVAIAIDRRRRCPIAEF